MPLCSHADNNCYIQIASFKRIKSAIRYFNFIKEIPYRTAIFKVNKWYAIRIGPFDDKSCKLIYNKISKRFKDRIIIHNKTNCEIVKENSRPQQHGTSEITEMIGSKKDKVASTGLKSAKTESNSSSGLRELYIEKAKVCMGKRDCKNAIKYLKLAISLGDHSAKTYTYLGYTYYHLGDYAKAIQTFNKAIEIDNNYSESYEGIGLVYLKLKSPFAAQTALKKAFELNPDEISYGINLAVAFISSGDFKESLSVLDKLEDRYPLVPEVHYNKAIVLLKQNKVKEAIRELKIFVELAKSPYYRDYTDKVRQVIGMFERRENEH